MATTNSQQALISVIIPIFNAAPYLEQALDSVQNQSYKNLEIICLNDGSTDDSLNTIQKFAMEDKRIKVIDKQNQGYGATCNRGIEESTGDWIAILEPDDWLELSMFEDLLNFADSFDEEVDIIKSAYWRIWMPDTPEQQKMNCGYRHRIRPKQQPFAIEEAPHLLTHHPSIWTALYRKSFLNDKNIRFREYPGAGWADNPFLIETLCQTDKIIYLDKAYYCYREDTPEKLAAFAQRSTLLPMERWNDMMDIIEKLGITNETILRAHYSRGFTYLSGVLEEVDLSHDEVLDAAIYMFLRMDANLVLSDPQISPGCKRLFCLLTGIDCPYIQKLPYAAGLVKEGSYYLLNTNVGFTWYTLKNYFKKKKSRQGNV